MKYLLKNAKVFDAAHDYEAVTVLVDGERIAAVGADLPEEDAEVIDLTGRTLMPAFGDAHVHTKGMPGDFTDAMLSALAYNGVSMVKDLGILDGIALEPYLAFLKAQDEPGKVRVATAGRYIDVPGGYGAGPEPDATWGLMIDTPEEAADMVTYQFRAGVNGIKIGINDGAMHPALGKLSGAHVKAITKRAEELGIWTTAHVYKVEDLQMLVDNGIGEAAHTCNDAVIPDALIGKMIEKGIPMTTTIGDFDPQGPPPERIPPFIEAEAFMDMLKRNKEMTLRNLEKFYRMGGIVNVGTDLMHYEDAYKECAIPVNELSLLRNECGFSMMDTVRAATVNVAASCRFTDEGSIRPGNKANLIAFDGPLSDDFSQLLDLKMVMNRGVLLRRE